MGTPFWIFTGAIIACYIQLPQPRHVLTMDIDTVKLSDIIDMESPTAVLKEVIRIYETIAPGESFDLLLHGWGFTICLYEGRMAGYQACNTGYHDLKHATDTFLTMARLLHGATLADLALSPTVINTSLIAALLHDAGYIQHDDDLDGTGAKYTQSHVVRSMDFVSRHAEAIGLSGDQLEMARMTICCTDLAVTINDLDFADALTEKLGRLLMAADLLSQMSDRKYLEKLLFLYREFKEANFGDYSSGRDLLLKTLGFYDYVEAMMGDTLQASESYLASHFATRWGIPVNLYRRSIDNQKNYLKEIIHRSDYEHERYLKRGGIVQHIKQAYGAI
jgi:hypothetical protein